MRTSVGLALFLSTLTLPAQNASAQLAEKKVLTSATAQKMVTAAQAVTARDFIEMKGGLPITVDGQVIGGIGTSFDTPEHDEQIAKAGLAAFWRSEGLHGSATIPSLH